MSEPYFGCPYCGDHYDQKLSCCGESRTHGVWITSDGEQWGSQAKAEQHEAALSAKEQA